MIAATSPQQEERAALRRARALQRANKVKARNDARRARTALRAALSSTRKRYPACRCELAVDVPLAQLRSMEGCCPRYVCPRLDAVRMALGRYASDWLERS